MDVIRKLVETAPATLDLTRREHFELADEMAGALRDAYGSNEALAALETRLVNEEPAVPLILHLAVKLARSRVLLDAIPGNLFVSVVFAVYKEHNRIRARGEHPHGEDFLKRKIAQLRRLFESRPNTGWELIVVDDGCPEGTGRIARGLIESGGHDDVARVLFLDDAIGRGLPVTRPLTSTDASRKGGSILYGLWDAARREREGRHVIVFTDADLSTHLGQTGLLIAPLVEGALAAIGSRREPTSVVIKRGLRNDRGKLFIYLWKRLLPQLRDIVDTQCGFKGFDADLVRGIVTDIGEKRFAFDIELLLRTELERPGSIAKVPVCWIDSEAESTTTDLQPYRDMLQSIVAMYHRYLPASPAAEPFARFLEKMDEETWNRIVKDIPEAITSRDPAEFSRFDGVSPVDLVRYRER